MAGGTERRRKVGKAGAANDEDVAVRARALVTPLPIDRTGRVAEGLSRGDAGARAGVLVTLQREAGNAAVQREVEAPTKAYVDFGGRLGKIAVENMGQSTVAFSGGTFQELRFVLGVRETDRVGETFTDAYATDRVFPVVTSSFSGAPALRSARVTYAIADGPKLEVRLKGSVKRKKP